MVQSSSEPVSLADLDVINPYFRSREAVDRLAELGIHTLVPPGPQAGADLPIILPEIKGAIGSPQGTVILDVGGDDLGARVLSSLQDAFRPGSYEMLFVMNANRPFTSTVESAGRVLQEIAAASRLSITGLVANSHMLEDTTVQDVLDGLALTRQVAEASGLPVVFVSALETVIEEIADKVNTIPLLPLHRSLLKPWERERPAAD
jgi:hypothetical protein